MKKEVVELTSKDFDKFVASGNAIVDFWAEWCGPCKIMEPHFEAAASALNGKVKFGKVNVDKEPELSERFQVMSIPTTIFFKGKEQVDRTVGAIPKDEILSRVKQNF